MKTIRSIAMVLIIAVLALLASCEKAVGQIPSTPATFVFPQIGTYSNVLQYAVKSANDISISFFTCDTNGTQNFYASFTYEGQFPTNKDSFDQYIAARATSLINGICTNTNPNIDRSKGIVMYNQCSIVTWPNGVSLGNLLYSYSSYQLIKNPDGTYSPPDLSGYSTELDDPIPVYVPNLEWARLEIGDVGDPEPIEIDDPNYDYESDPMMSDGYLYLPTSYITNSSSASGDFWMKISLYIQGATNAFQIYNGDGNQIPETLFRLSAAYDPTNDPVNIHITVNGGDPGRAYMLQWSSDMKNWTNGAVQFVSPAPEIEAIPPQFTNSLNDRMFFRTATTNLPPTN